MSESCREAEALLSSYHDGELDAADTRQVEAHLESCEECRAVLEAFVANDALLQGSTVHRTEAEWDALADRVEDTLDREAADRDRSREGTAPRTRWFGWRPRSIVLGSAGTLMLAVFVALLQPWSGLQKAAPEKTLGRMEAGIPVDELAEAEKKEAASPSAARERLAARSFADLDANDDEPARTIAGEEGDDTLGRSSSGTVSGPTATPESTPADARLDESKSTSAPTPTESMALTKTPTLAAAPEPLAEEVARPEAEDITFGLAQDVEADLPVESELSRHGLGPQAPEGATSLAEVRDWWARQSEPRSNKVSSNRAAPPDTDDAFLDEALAGARRLRSSGDRLGSVEAFRLLSGDFPENRVREDAWFELLRVRSDAALSSADAEATTDIARSFDAFRIRYPHRNDILELRARVWVHVARLDVDKSCAGARQRVYEWRDAEASERRQGEATVLRGTLDRICGDDAAPEDDR